MGQRCPGVTWALKMKVSLSDTCRIAGASKHVSSASNGVHNFSKAALIRHAQLLCHSQVPQYWQQGLPLRLQPFVQDLQQLLI